MPVVEKMELWLSNMNLPVEGEGDEKDEEGGWAWHHAQSSLVKSIVHSW